MATDLVVRNVEAEVVRALNESAALHGRSVEAEHHEILRAALITPVRRPIKAVVTNTPDVGADQDVSFRNSGR
ncbi:DNA-binding protein [Candidimonas sp. SYP-B2681]|uniref:FitA-like ribbon-helix-helix domain-containing protein n=1 Tax=Candidimonas sp. SYP-B2681 TaxID=2497686 RepID=UPI000F8621B4|nr:DNA-binding protein [Candidimonas sp. SYP-B2681]RTZ39309.1 DNA-binding protein [Candidimonas sp. SYP-B2681]